MIKGTRYLFLSFIYKWIADHTDEVFIQSDNGYSLWTNW